jgi:cytochrome P450
MDIQVAVVTDVSYVRRVTVDLLTPEAVSDPYAAFGEWRESGPVVWSDSHRAWLITRYSGVRAGFSDAERLSSDRLTPYWRRLPPKRIEKLGTAFELLRGWMVFHDAPMHAALRDPVRKAFTPRQLDRLRPKIQKIAAELLDAMVDRDELDFKAEFAFPLPALVIAELMGVEGSARGRFKDWSTKLAAIVFGESNKPDQDERAAEGAAEFVEFFGWLIQRRRAEPGDDLVSALLAAFDESELGEANPDQAGGLTEVRLIGACTLLLFAGHETTTNLLANSALALANHPDQARLLLERPELIELAVEELLRFDGPVKVMVRAVSRDHERDGVQLRRGEMVYLGISGAQRDPRAWDRPDQLVLDRPFDRTRPGLAFGQGAHFCLGAALARLEARLAVPAMLNRFPRMRVLTDSVRWEPQIVSRTMVELPVAPRG